MEAKLPLQEKILGLRIDRGSMQMVQHHMIYSPEGTKIITQQYKAYHSLITKLAFFSLCWHWLLIPLHHVLNGFLFVPHHVSSISVGL
jgi:hypothetical protein